MELFRRDQPDGFKTARLNLNVVEIAANGTRNLITVTVSHADVAVIWRLPFIA